MNSTYNLSGRELWAFAIKSTSSWHHHQLLMTMSYLFNNIRTLALKVAWIFPVTTDSKVYQNIQWQGQGDHPESEIWRQRLVPSRRLIKLKRDKLDLTYTTLELVAGVHVYPRGHLGDKVLSLKQNTSSMGSCTSENTYLKQGNSLVAYFLIVSIAPWLLGLLLQDIRSSSFIFT